MNFPKLTFTAQIFREGRQYVSFNPELRVASCGKTADIAKEKLKDCELRNPQNLLKYKGSR